MAFGAGRIEWSTTHDGTLRVSYRCPMENEHPDLCSPRPDKPVWSPPRLQLLSLIEVESVADLDVGFTCTYTQPTSDLR